MKTKITVVIILAVVVLVFLFLIFGGKGKANSAALDAFAQCVAGKGLVMYGAYWCSHCQNEKKAFGDSFKHISYVECADNPKQCTDKGVTGFPTWIFPDGKKLEGEQGIVGLAKATGCVLENASR